MCCASVGRSCPTKAREARRSVSTPFAETGLAREAVIERMIDSFRLRYGLADGKVTDEELARAQERARTKFTSPDWTARVP